MPHDNAPSFDALMAAWADLQTALADVRDARSVATAAAGVFNDLLAAFLGNPAGGMTAAETAGLVTKLKDQAATLGGIRTPP